MRAVLFTGGVETLDHFSRMLAKTLERRGVQCFVLDLREAEGQSRKLRKFIKTGETFVLTFNYEGLEREKGLYTLRDSYLWQQYKIPVYNIAVDHPYWYEDRAADLLEDEAHHPGLLSLYRHLSIDRNHETYFKTFYPEFKSAGFLPLAGTELMPEEPELLPRERKQQILFAGHYTELPFFEQHITAIDEEYEAFYRGIISELCEHPDETVEAAELAAVKRETGETDIKKLRYVLYRMLFIDLYVRNYFRGKAVAALVNGGCPVTVIGKGWEKLPLERRDKLTILPMTDSVGVLKALREYRVSLNVLPFFKDGAHDRVFNSILNGAVSLSDPSRYLLEELPEGCGVSYYTLESLSALKNSEISIIAAGEHLLTDNAACEEILEKGQKIVRERHTWAARAEEILKIVKEEKL